MNTQEQIQSNTFIHIHTCTQKYTTTTIQVHVITNLNDHKLSLTDIEITNFPPVENFIFRCDEQFYTGKKLYVQQQFSNVGIL